MKEYNENLQFGEEFQDFIVLKMYKLGMPVIPFSSKMFQLGGESLTCHEIKLDTKMRQTKNIYIEIAEKKNANNLNYVKSGIERDDNTKFWIIGDYDGVYFFSKTVLKTLIRLHDCRKVQTPTSIGYLLPVKLADMFSEYYNFKEVETVIYNSGL